MSWRRSRLGMKDAPVVEEEFSLEDLMGDDDNLQVVKNKDKMAT